SGHSERCASWRAEEAGKGILRPPSPRPHRNPPRPRRRRPRTPDPPPPLVSPPPRLGGVCTTCRGRGAVQDARRRPPPRRGRRAPVRGGGRPPPPPDNFPKYGHSPNVQWVFKLSIPQWNRLPSGNCTTTSRLGRT